MDALNHLFDLLELRAKLVYAKLHLGCVLYKEFSSEQKPMANAKVTAIAHPNIAFIKYWGNRDAHLRLPLNDSISMNLDALATETTVQFDDSLSDDQVVIDEEEVTDAVRARVVQHLDRVRADAKIDAKARVMSRNNFPSGTGLASSASGFAALTLAATRAAGLELNERELSILARSGSGSACRSIPGGFVEWIASTSSNGSFARTIASPDFWDLRDVVVIVTRDEKKVGSSNGHRAALTSPFMGERLSRLPVRYHRVRRALLARDLPALGVDIEAEALELHMIAATSRPPILYWSPGMVRVIQAAQEWRAGGVPVYFTLDAGPNVHLICEAKDAETVTTQARALEDAQDVIVNAPGGAARAVDNHLF
jgi:diphosphomevalonate decarboxylase